MLNVAPLCSLTWDTCTISLRYTHSVFVWLFWTKLRPSELKSILGIHNTNLLTTTLPASHLLTSGLYEFDLAEEGFFLIPQKTKTYLMEFLNFGFWSKKWYGGSRYKKKKHIGRVTPKSKKKQKNWIKSGPELAFYIALQKKKYKGRVMSKAKNIVENAGVLKVAQNWPFT